MCEEDEAWAELLRRRWGMRMVRLGTAVEVEAVGDGCRRQELGLEDSGEGEL